MAILTTGLIDNTPVSGVRPTSRFQIRIANNDPIITGTVEITGIRLIGDTVMDTYVLELFTIPPNTAVIRNYFANFDAFEYLFNPVGTLEISSWGKDVAGNLVAAHRVLPSELNL